MLRGFVISYRSHVNTLKISIFIPFDFVPVSCKQSLSMFYRVIGLKHKKPSLFKVAPYSFTPKLHWCIKMTPKPLSCVVWGWNFHQTFVILFGRFYNSHFALKLCLPWQQRAFNEARFFYVSCHFEDFLRWIIFKSCKSMSSGLIVLLPYFK